MRATSRRSAQIERSTTSARDEDDSGKARQGGETAVNNGDDVTAAADVKRQSDRSWDAGRRTGQARTKSAVRAALVALIAARRAVAAAPARVDAAQAQRLIADQRGQAHRDGHRHGRQVRGRAHRQQLRRPHGRRSRGRRRQPADRPRAVDPRQEDRHHARLGLWRRQEADRHVRRRGVLRHLAAAAEIAPLPGGGIRVSSVNGRIMLSGTAPDAVTLDKAVTIAKPVRARRHQHGPGDAAAAGHAGGALRRGHAPGRPRPRRAVEHVRQQHARQHRQPHAGQLPITPGRSAAAASAASPELAASISPIAAAGVLSRQRAVRLPGRPADRRRHHDRCHRSTRSSRRASPAAWPSRTSWRCPATPRASSPAANIRSRCPARSADHHRLQELRRRPRLHADGAERTA